MGAGSSESGKKEKAIEGQNADNRKTYNRCKTIAISSQNWL